MVKQKWVTDAGRIDVDNIKNFIHVNKDIRTFLSTQGMMFLSANKGMGKTLILTYKRFLLMEENHSAIFIPRNRPILDNMGFIPDLSREKGAFIIGKNLCMRLWLLSIKISVLTQGRVQLYENEDKVLQDLPFDFYSMITKQDHAQNPTVIFRQIISKTPKEITRILNNFAIFIDMVFLRVKSEVHIFIDKVDQALSGVTQEAWVGIQGALIEASWNLHSENTHIYVHASIRQEAYTNYQSPIKANFNNSTLVLKYEKSELLMMLNRMSFFYEDASFKDFIGREEFFNTLARQTEDAMGFILRNTLNRPRDLVTIASKLSLGGPNLVEAKFIDTVVEACNVEIIPSVFDEVEVFLNCLHKKENRERFFMLIKYNILTSDDLTKIYAEFNGMDAETLQVSSFTSDQLDHPFIDLYKAGLLGVVSENGQQRFTQPYDLLNFNSVTLPKSAFYLLHPSLKGYIYAINKQYSVFKYVITGHACEWNDFYARLVSIQRVLISLDHQEIYAQCISYLDQYIETIRQNQASPRDPRSVSITEKLQSIVEDHKSSESTKENAFILLYKLEEIHGPLESAQL